MNSLTYIILATILISSGSLIGVITLSFNQKFLNHTLSLLLALSAGTMLGAAFLHLLPESIETLGTHIPMYLLLAAFISFFLIEKILHWHHCHGKEDCNEHQAVGYLNLLGDFLHNFLDGVVIAGAFATSVPLGMASTLAIILHEVPQEIGDFGVLIHSGFSRTKALVSNVAVSLTSVLGGLLGYYLTQTVSTLADYLVPFAAGGFVYIAASDLIPEMKGASTLKRTFFTLATFLGGLGLMFLVH